MAAVGVGEIHRDGPHSQDRGTSERDAQHELMAPAINRYMKSQTHLRKKLEKFCIETSKILKNQQVLLTTILDANHSSASHELGGPARNFGQRGRTVHNIFNNTEEDP